MEGGVTTSRPTGLSKEMKMALGPYKIYGSARHALFVRSVLLGEELLSIGRYQRLQNTAARYHNLDGRPIYNTSRDKCSPSLSLISPIFFIRNISKIIYIVGLADSHWV